VVVCGERLLSPPAECRPLRVLLLHNYYRFGGGEDIVVQRERDLLVAHGHDVRLYSVSNKSVGTTWQMFMTAWQAPYSMGARRRVAIEIEHFRPDVVHVHNFFPLLTPSVYGACRAARVPVVQTLHNFRLTCLNALLFRDGHVCEDCLGRLVPWPGILHACYQKNPAASGMVAAMLTLHRLLGTWSKLVDVYVAPTDFVRKKLIEGGLPAEKIVVKPHFVEPDPGPGPGPGDYALFVGRLTLEKGINTVLTACERFGGRLPLKIVGEGPEEHRVRAAVQRIPGVEWLGKQSSEGVQALMKDAMILLFPSAWYETFGLVIAEAYAAGVPVIAGDHGSMAGLVEEGRTGCQFRFGDPDELADKVEWLWSHPHERAEMGRAARREFEQKYSAGQNYKVLMDIYALAGERARRSDMGLRATAVDR
jgi:glycosyltransferase involved in cell wall biosynthesis